MGQIKISGSCLALNLAVNMAARSAKASPLKAREPCGQLYMQAAQAMQRSAMV